MATNQKISPEEVQTAVELSTQALLNRYGVSALSQNEQVEALNTISAQLVKEVMARMIDRMSDQEAVNFSEYLQTDPKEEDVYRLLLAEDGEAFIQTIEEVAREFTQETDYVLEDVGT